MKKLAVVFASALAVAFLSTASFAADCPQDKDKKCCSSSDKSACKAAAKDASTQAVVVDPVCGMDIETKDAKHTYEYKGKTYYFCCDSCKKSFSKKPEKYLGKESKQAK